MSSKYRLLRVSQFNVKSLSAVLKPAALRRSLKLRVCFLRVPSGGGSAAGEQRQSRQPEQSPEAGEGGCRTGQQSGAATGEEEEEEGGPHGCLSAVWSAYFKIQPTKQASDRRGSNWAVDFISKTCPLRGRRFNINAVSSLCFYELFVPFSGRPLVQEWNISKKSPGQDPQMTCLFGLLRFTLWAYDLLVVNTGMLQFSIWDQLLLQICREHPRRIHPGAVGGSKGERGVSGGRCESI